MTPWSGFDPDYVWPDDPLEVTWSRRYQDLEHVRRFAATMPAGPHRDLVTAFLTQREGRPDLVLETLGRLTGTDAFDEKRWTARLLLLQASVLHKIGLLPQALEVAEQGLVAARDSGHPNLVLIALHDGGGMYERSNATRTMEDYLRTIELAETVTGAPPHARDELDALRALAIVNLHLVAARADLPLPRTAPDLATAQSLAQASWPALGAATQAFRGLAAAEEGDLRQARDILAGLPDALGMTDIDNAVKVAAGEAVRLAIDGRHAEALELLERMSERAPLKYLPELLERSMRIHEENGDFESAYRVSRRLTDHLQQVFGEDTQATVRALEVWYRTARHRQDAEAARKESLAIAAAAESWRRGSLRDPLTDLWNRRHLDQRLARLEGTTGHQVAVVDLDRFKTINDHHGHVTGDDVLRAVASSLRGATRGEDLVARLGGDEFGVVRFAGTPEPLARDLASVTSTATVTGSPVTLSIGVAIVDEEGFGAAFRRADAAMYEAKASGGGCIRLADAVSDTGSADGPDPASTTLVPVGDVPEHEPGGVGGEDRAGVPAPTATLGP